jgi:lantibiotic biosynthesis protein
MLRFVIGTAPARSWQWLMSLIQTPVWVTRQDFLGSALPSAAESPSQRDERLLALAWQAMAEGSGEVVLTEESILALTDNDRFDQRYIPPHVELAGRIQAASAQALERGDYTLTVAPARAAGTLTSRFTPMATGSGLEEAYRALPNATEGALTGADVLPTGLPAR